MAVEHRVIQVTGTVQGVGFRPFVHRHAVALGLSGRVGNEGATVVIEVQGSSEEIDELVRRIQAEPPPLAEVSTVRQHRRPLHDLASGFRISGSTLASVRDVAVTPDVATCRACLAELRDPSNRRYRHPFIACTDCGPRYTIIRAVPYDRSRTTMAPFPMCDACRREYEDPTDRRFHAEPIACPACGPQLRLVDADGRELATADAALERATALLASGGIVAVKGLGGFHLAVDASDDDAVMRLRARKSRDDKPFAVMVPDVATAQELCVLDDEACAELASARAPIVLAARRGSGGVSDAVAPGLPELGLMVPYTPLHHLLLEGLGGPLVMTSGNRSDEPIVHEDDRVIDRLGALADAVLLHDRAINIRCDDSVVRVSPGGLQVLRRSRGHAPGRIDLPVPAPVPLLAVGPELKSTVAVAEGDHLVVSHHLGDLEHLAAYQAFEQAIQHLQKLTGIAAELVVHDLHPEYLSTKWAVDRELPTLAVQHHHAHVASCLVEHGRRDAVLGITFDGLGLGTDGTLWGGELLVADLLGARRVGHLRPVPQPGGAAAIREPWRMALVWLERAVGPGAAADYGRSVDERWEAVRSLSYSPRTPTTTSAGRLFDAAAALIGLRPRVSYEGHAAIELEAVAARVPDVDAPVYEMEVCLAGGMLSLDPAALLASVWAERAAGTPPAVLSAGFHAGFAAAVVRAAAQLVDRHGLDTVALTGGVFQNRRLSRIVRAGLEELGIEVLVHRRIPPNDGGISVGQVAVAAATVDAEQVPTAGLGVDGPTRHGHGGHAGSPSTGGSTEPEVGIEPTTSCLQDRCSTD